MTDKAEEMANEAAKLLDVLYDEASPLRACGDCRKCSEDLRAALAAYRRGEGK